MAGLTGESVFMDVFATVAYGTDLDREVTRLSMVLRNADSPKKRQKASAAIREFIEEHPHKTHTLFDLFSTDNDNNTAYNADTIDQHIRSERKADPIQIGSLKDNIESLHKMACGSSKENGNKKALIHLQSIASEDQNTLQNYALYWIKSLLEEESNAVPEIKEAAHIILKDFYEVEAISQPTNDLT